MKRTFVTSLFCLTMGTDMSFATAGETMLPETERYNATKKDLDRAPTEELVGILGDDHVEAAMAVRHARYEIAAAVDAAVRLLEDTGRFIYVGAGTSGRLGVLDAVELWPTFGWPNERAECLMAGGETALTRAVEGAEDSIEAAQRDFEESFCDKHDVVILLSASGGAPYVRHIAKLAREAGALTIGVSSSKDSPLLSLVEHKIYLPTGPESLQGSTRLKAGTAQKVMLSTFSTAVMMKLGYVFEGYMINVKATNDKLVARRLRITRELTGLDEASANALLSRADGDNRVALLIHRLGLTKDTALKHLETHKGNVRRALEAGAA